jgi:hypothetical protein
MPIETHRAVKVASQHYAAVGSGGHGLLFKTFEHSRCIHWMSSELFWLHFLPSKHKLFRSPQKIVEIDLNAIAEVSLEVHLLRCFQEVRLQDRCDHNGQLTFVLVKPADVPGYP